ncbi:hypothetical protein [Maribacter aestuarii]|uniref:hypothetical protein n=1 Tax=Maribacter aestuarii TaxID=1130723 RepID=UPI00248D0EB4|nr:hypothetical protein [Maribacter aestuarii]
MSKIIELDEKGFIIDLDSFIENVEIEIDTPIYELIADAEGEKIDGADCTLYYNDKIAAGIRFTPCGCAKLSIYEGFERYKPAFWEVLDYIELFYVVEEILEEIDEYNLSLELS